MSLYAVVFITQSADSKLQPRRLLDHLRKQTAVRIGSLSIVLQCRAKHRESVSYPSTPLLFAMPGSRCQCVLQLPCRDDYPEALLASDFGLLRSTEVDRCAPFFRLSCSLPK